MKGRDTMGRLTIIFIGFVLISYIIVFLKKPALAMQGLRFGGISLFKAIPIIIAAFALGGLLQALIPADSFSRWLGPQKGFWAVFLGSLLGGMIIAQIEMIVGFFISPILTTFAYFMVFLIIVTLRPSGLLGFQERRS